jgi:type I restriction enzyme S subunit
MNSDRTTFGSEITLKDAVQFIVDNRGKTAPTEPTGIALIATNCVNNNDLYPQKLNLRFVSQDTYDNWFRSHPQPGDILLTNKGSQNGAVCLVPNPVDFCIAQDMVALRADPKKINPLYLLAALRSDIVQNRIKALNVDAVIPHLKKTDFDKLFIPLPDSKTQEWIGNFYFELSSRIELLKETNATLEAIAQALFKSWFVDFDPVHAKQQGRAPEGMDEATAALFPDSFEESELGLIPKGWKSVTLADAYEINPQRKLKKGDLAPYLDMASVPTSGHCVEQAVLREMGSGSKFTNGDALLARITPCLENGKSAFVDFLPDGQVGWGSTEFVVMRPKPPLSEYHAYLLCRHQSFRDFAIQSMSGTSGRQRIQNDVLGRYLLASPSTSVATAFGEITTPVQQKIAANHVHAQTLAFLRDTLLPRLISCQLRLPEATEIVTEMITGT